MIMSNLEGSSTAPPIASSNIGFQLLKKHGWKEGTGLGISEQGRLEPVQTYLKKNKRGLGAEIKKPQNIGYPKNLASDKTSDKMARRNTRSQELREGAEPARRTRGRPATAGHGNGNQGSTDGSNVNIAEEIARGIQNSLPTIIAQVQAAMNANSGGNEEDQQPPVVDEQPLQMDQPIVQGHGCDFKSFMQTQPSSFDGKGGPIAVMNWLAEMESCFAICQCAATQKARFASAKLKGNALYWWNTIQGTRGIEEAAAMGWFEFRRLLRERFCPLVQMKALEQEFLKLEQGRMTVEKYVGAFTEKARFAGNYILNEEMRTKRFVFGLRREIRGMVEMFEPTTYQRAMDLATLAERNLVVPKSAGSFPKRKFDGKSFNNKFKKTRFGGKDSGNIPSCPKCNKRHAGQCRAGVCFKCGKAGHMANVCTEPRVEIRGPTRACYGCGATDHIIVNCPKKNAAEPLKLTPGASSSKPDLKGKGRVFQMSAEEAQEIPDMVTVV